MSLIYLLLLLLCALTLSSAHVRSPPNLYDLADAESIFEEFIKNYIKLYASAASEPEKQDRFNIFKDNLALVNKLRLEQPQASFDIQKHSALTHDEFQSSYLGFLPQLSTIKPEKVTVRENLPDSFDWRDHNAVTPVKSQKSCGACWAFSTTGTIEGAYAIKHENLVSFSEQQLVSCDDTNSRCTGGDMARALDYLKKVGGIEAESDYPYEAVNGTCKFDKSKVVAQITGYKTITFGNDDEIKQALIDNGPISISIWATSSEFKFYESGVIKCPSGRSDQINHAVLIVGYGTENGTPYWLLKNSWGSSLGDNGYWKVMQGNNPCGMNYYPGVVAQVA